MDRIDIRLLVEAIVSSLYGDFDNWRRGLDHWVCELGVGGESDEAADLTRGALLVWRSEATPDGYTDAHYRVGWRVRRADGGGYASGRGTPWPFVIDFDPFEAWVPVTPETTWTEAERAAARIEKQERAHGVQRVFGPAPALAEAGRAQTRRLGAAALGAPAEDLVPSDGETRFTLAAEIRMASDDNTSTVFFTSDEVDRHRTYVDPDGVDTSQWERNAVVLWDHGRDPRRGNVPIARGLSVVDKTVTLDGRQVRGKLATIEWADDPFAQDIRNKVRGGFLSMASMGWIVPEGGLGEHEVTVEGRVVRVPAFRRSEMTEFSIVAIGSNRQAFVQERSLHRAAPAAPAATAPAGVAAAAPVAAAPPTPPTPADQQRGDAAPPASEPSAAEPTGPGAAGPAPVVIPRELADPLIREAVEAGLALRREQEAALGRQLVDSLTGRA